MRVSAIMLLAGTVYAQAPAINPGGIVNAASYSAGPVAPGSVVSLFGANLASQTVSAAAVPLPTALGNVASVTFNGQAAALYFVAPGQINAQVPWNTPAGPVNVIVTTAAGASTAQTVQVALTAPGIFAAGANGLGQAIATDNADGAIAALSGSMASAATHPIAIGGYLILWCTGLGAVDLPVANGANTGGAIANTLVKPMVSIGGVPATLVYSILSPQYAGEYQVAVQVAPGTPTGISIPVRLQMNGTTAAETVTVAVASPPAPPAQPQQTACTLSSVGCTAITINGDPPSPTAFSGYADPTIRQDPLTGTLWMAYSWPHTISSGAAGVAGTQAIDTHVAFSTDGGHSWTYKGALYTSQAAVNPVTGATDYTAHEVMNLLPYVVNGVTYWFGIHSTYNVTQASGGGSGQESYSKRWLIASAPGTASGGPMALAGAPSQYLGQPINTYPQYFPVAVNLSRLDPEVSGCAEYYEPALLTANGSLYLYLACTGAGATTQFYAVFKNTNPLGPVADWTWTYVPQGSSRFAVPADAVSVARYLNGPATYITQMDIAPGRNPGGLLAILTAAYNTSSGKVSLGCAAVELAAVDPPRLVYNAAGQVQVDAFLTSADSEDGGPGSCTYSPASATGLILAHRQSSKAPQNGGFFTFLMQSALLP